MCKVIIYLGMARQYIRSSLYNKTQLSSQSDFLRRAGLKLIIAVSLIMYNDSLVDDYRLSHSAFSANSFSTWSIIGFRYRTSCKVRRE